MFDFGGVGDFGCWLLCLIGNFGWWLLDWFVGFLDFGFVGVLHFCSFVGHHCWFAGVLVGFSLGLCGAGCGWCLWV